MGFSFVYTDQVEAFTNSQMAVVLIKRNKVHDAGDRGYLAVTG